MTEAGGVLPVEELTVSLAVNGKAARVTVPVRLLLSDFLRDTLGMTGTHVGCEHGVCGACTVLLDGEPVRSCITLTVSCDGHQVTTVEGLSPEHGLSRLQRDFAEAGALQCGFCTPGMLVTLSTADPAEHADDDAIRELLAGHLCRCTGYSGVVTAVRRHWGREAR